MHPRIEYNRLYSEKHKEKIAAYQREYRKKNQDRLRQEKKKWRHENKEKVRAYQEAYVLRNPENRANSSSVYYYRNRKRYQRLAQLRYAFRKEEIKEARKAWRAANPDRCRVNGQNQRVRREYAIGDRRINPDEWAHLKMIHGEKCGYCGSAESLTMDHAVPLSRGGIHAIENIVPACRSCNSIKGTKTASEFWPIRPRRNNAS